MVLGGWDQLWRLWAATSLLPILTSTRYYSTINLKVLMLLTVIFWRQDVVKQNIDHNSLMLCNRGLVRKGAVQVRFERLRWGEKNDEDSLQDGTGPFDVIIMADVVYNPEALELLEQTLDRLSTSAPSISIYLSQRTRFKIIEKHFLERLEKFFEITKVLEVTAKHYDPDTAVNVFRFALRN